MVFNSLKEMFDFYIKTKILLENKRKTSNDLDELEI
jgi:hypothetical protein